MTVGLVGSGPALQPIEAAIEDAGDTPERVDVGDLGTSHRLAVVVGQAGDQLFERVTERVRDAELPWFGVELGGIGGYPVVSAAVTGFEPDGPCYDCLVTRVGSNVDPEAQPEGPPPDVETRLAGAIAGRLVERQLDPASGDQLGTVVEVPYTERTLFPVPGCDCGRGRDRILDRGHLDRDLSRALARAERGLDERVGLVSDVGEIQSYPAPYYLATGTDTTTFSDVQAQQQAAGVDEGWDGAFMKALGEALERYCAGVYRESEFETGPPEEVASPVEPSAFVTPDDWAAPDPTRELQWVRGGDISSEDRVHLPAELVHYPPPTEEIRPAITTGLGLGNSSVEALLSGLYEVIERDAATIAWYSDFDPLGLVVDDDRFERLARRAGSEGLEVTPLLLTQDVDVPVVAVAVYRDEWPTFAIATAADLDPDRAARAALTEAVQSWLELREMGREAARDDESAIARYAERPETTDPFVDPIETVPAASVGPNPVPDGQQELAAVLDRLDDVGLDAFAARTTTRDVQRMGFEAVRVVVPKAQPLAFGDIYFGERAETVPREMGFEPQLDRDHHPYP